ncbi:MAG: hypothetical protein GX190_03465 [Mollicutes bacterium]|nr:hypothetical protein [Mollicutes bacterium]
MKKYKNLGFMLTETLIVSTFISVTLIYMFIQFQKINQNYNRTFSYNTVNNLYATKQIINYIMDVDYSNIKDYLTNSNEKFLTLTNCPSHLFLEPNYCKKLFEALKIQDVYFTYEDLSIVKNAMRNDHTVLEETITFLDYIDYQPGAQTFRLIVHYQDGTYASLRLKEGI